MTLLRLRGRDYTIANWQIDAIALAEINQHWAKVQFDQRLQQRTKEWYMTSKWAVGYNRRERPAKIYQPGGTAVFVQEYLTGYNVANGTDLKGLGRWTWMRFRGKNGVMLRVVAAYGPHSNGGATSAVAQQRSALRKDDDQRHPIQALWEDLTAEAKGWKEQGDHLVIGGDWNQDVEKGRPQELCQELDLRDAIKDRHGKCPNSTPTGTKTIDSIFVSRSITVQRSGYSAFTETIGMNELCNECC